MRRSLRFFKGAPVMPGCASSAHRRCRAQRSGETPQPTNNAEEGGITFTEVIPPGNSSRHDRRRKSLCEGPPLWDTVLYDSAVGVVCSLQSLYEV